MVTAIVIFPCVIDLCSRGSHGRAGMVNKGTPVSSLLLPLCHPACSVILLRPPGVTLGPSQQPGAPSPAQESVLTAKALSASDVESSSPAPDAAAISGSRVPCP